MYAMRQLTRDSDCARSFIFAFTIDCNAFINALILFANMFDNQFENFLRFK